MEIRGRAGSVSITEEDRLLLVRPRGYVGRRMLLHGLREAGAFGTARPEGWWHVTDASRFVIPNPVNPLILRRVRKLPNIRGYVLVVPSRILRFTARLFWRRLIAADVVVRTVHEARALIVD